MDADPDPSYQEKFTKGVMLAPTLKIIVGIDFGTSNIGVAFRTISASAIVGVEVGDYQLKWPMCVVLEKAPPHNLVAIGPDSINIMHTRGVETLGMFRKFKMALHEGFEQSEIQADVGDFKVPAKILFARCFTKLGEMVRASILNGYNIQLDDTVNTVAWVLTVPGIWTDKAKQFMRRAMFDAGLIGEENSRNLHIVLEPESASLDVLRTVPFIQTKGTKFLLVDCGGGTIDCAGYEVLMMSPGEDGAVKLIEQFKSGGGPWGGTFVDAAFEKFLVEFFGDRGAQVIKPGSLALFELMMGEWEKAKCTFSGKNELAVNFTAVLDGGVDGVSLDELIAAYRAQHPEYAGLRRSPGSNARVLLPLDLVMSFFAEPLGRFSEYLEKLLRDVPDLNFVVGVGGFCQSPVLQRAIEGVCDKFKDVKARFPPRPSMAIVQGAVHTGVHIIKHQTTPVSERVVRRSYGVETSATFIPNGIFPDDRKRWDGNRGEFMVDKVFKPLVLAGDRASLDARKSCRLVPMYPDQDVVSINFFHCQQRDAKFITDAGVEPLGQVEMPVAKMQDLAPGASREVTVYLNFGLSELVAMVICKHTGESKRVIMKLPEL